MSSAKFLRASFATDENWINKEGRKAGIMTEVEDNLEFLLSE
jgi:hypothetical protein